MLPCGADELSVMSFNLRYPALDGHPWRPRAAVAAELIAREAPHIVGTQEGWYDQLDLIVSLLPARYAWLGEGRGGGNDDEFTAVIFDSEAIDVESVDVSWLSERPDTPGSISWGAAHPRTLTRVDCADRRTGTRLRVLNTHFDHASDEARSGSRDLLMAAVEEARAEDPVREVVVTGDFNVAQDSPLYSDLVHSPHLDDPFDSAELVNAQLNSFHRYRGPRRGGARIDWVLHSPGLRGVRAGLNPHSADGVLPSDHLPVQAVLGSAQRLRA